MNNVYYSFKNKFGARDAINPTGLITVEKVEKCSVRITFRTGFTDTLECNDATHQEETYRGLAKLIQVHKGE